MSQTTQHNLAELSSESTELRREVGLGGGMSVLAGIMIGSGIFYIGAIVLQRSGMSPGLALLVWLIGGLVTLLSGLCYAELGAMMPKAGGNYVYLRETYGERIAFISGFANFTLGNSGSIAALGVAFASALATFVPLDSLAQKIVAIIAVIVLSLVNIRGIRNAAWVNNLFMILKLAPIALILFAGLFLGEQHPDLLTLPAQMPSIGSLLSMIGFAVIATLWAYEGWTNLNVIAEEIRDPHRNIPLAIILSIVGVTILYVLFNYAIFRVLPFETIVAMVSSENFYLGTAVAQNLFGSTGLVIVGLAMVLAMFSSLSGCVMVFPRMYYAMARDGAFFASCAKLHPTYRTPVNAILASSGVAILLICFRSLSELTSLVAVTGMVFHGMTFYSVILLRKKYPTMERPYRVWLYPVTVFLIIAIMIGLTINTIINDPMTALLGVVVPMIGWVLYEKFIRQNVEALQRLQESHAH
ncbi:MAG: amino acid permease [Sutterella sp.]|nr:amino acid permease [Sutterella sp.]